MLRRVLARAMPATQPSRARAVVAAATSERCMSMAAVAAPALHMCAATPRRFASSASTGGAAVPAADGGPVGVPARVARAESIADHDATCKKAGAKKTTKKSAAKKAVKKTARKNTAAKKTPGAVDQKPMAVKKAGATAMKAADKKDAKNKNAVQELSSKWKLTASAVSQAFAKAQTQHRTSDLGIVFLLGKRVMHADQDERELRFKKLLNPPNDRWKACRRRLDRLVQLEGDTTWDTDPEGWQTLADFRAAVPGWQDHDIFHLRKGVSLPRRHQLSGLCYIHAPEVLQHYLVSLNQANVGMIDMVKLVRQTYDAKQLERHVFDDAGGSSHTVLQMILAPASVIVSAGVNEYAHHLQEYGPGLVAGFAVHDDFHKAASSSFDGAPTGNLVGHHAMVLIGARQDKASGKRWFLVQNWWKQSQFVEVSETYLKACGATVYFVETPQMQIPKAFPTQPHLIAENENVDKPEQLMPEFPVAPPKEFV